jgi:DNA-3-methyladenine glycosylase II
VKAASTISGRFEALFDDRGPSPDGVTVLSDARLRGVGLSGQKLAYLRDLSRRVVDGSLKLGALSAMEDEDVIAALTAVKGIGRWTAEMFLMFRLQRPDVLPVGDLGIVKAMQKVYGLRKMPSPARMTAIGERWRPYRSVASWYLWASLDNAPGKD